MRSNKAHVWPLMKVLRISEPKVKQSNIKTYMKVEIERSVLQFAFSGLGLKLKYTSRKGSLVGPCQLLILTLFKVATCSGMAEIVCRSPCLGCDMVYKSPGPHCSSFIFLSRFSFFCKFNKKKRKKHVLALICLRRFASRFKRTKMWN